MAVRDVAAMIDEMAARVARAEARVPPVLPCFFGEVVDGGDMPSETEKYYLLQPQSVTGSEAEGDPGMLSAYNEPVPVVVIGAVPEVGDKLVAHFCDHRWVASKIAPGNICKLCGMEGTFEFMLTFTFSEGLIATGYGTRSVSGTGEDISYGWSIIPGSPDDDYAGFGVDPAEFTLPLGFLRCNKDGAIARFYGLRTTTEDDPDPTNAITPDVELDSSHIVSCDPLYIVWSGELPLRRPLDHIGNLIGFEAQATL